MHISGLMNTEKVDIERGKVDIEREKADIGQQKVDIEGMPIRICNEGEKTDEKKQVYFNAMLSGVDMFWMQKQCSGRG